MSMIPIRWLEALPRNIWIGTSCEDQRRADERIPHLLRVPARVRFLSCEPLLGGVILQGDGEYNSPFAMRSRSYLRGVGADQRIHWVIVGGESGHGARPMDSDWVWLLRDQCKAADTAFFFKQWGEYVSGLSRDGDPFELSNGQTFDTGEMWPHPRVHVWESIQSHNGDYATYRCRASVSVGKHAAGRLLDGRTWDELPA